MHEPRDGQGRNMVVVCVRPLFCGDCPRLWLTERSVRHQDDRLMGGGGMAGHSHDLLCHLVHIYLGGEWREEGNRGRRVEEQSWKNPVRET